MASLSAAAVLAIAQQCLPPALAPIAAGIALHENPRGDTLAVNHNPNGTDDFGLAQINSTNFGWLSKSLNTPVNRQTIVDPCVNLTAAIRVLFVRYNGNPPDAMKVAYANGVTAQIRKLDGAVQSSAMPDPGIAIDDRPANTQGETSFNE